jgi:hypothetical protein
MSEAFQVGDKVMPSMSFPFGTDRFGISRNCIGTITAIQDNITVDWNQNGSAQQATYNPSALMKAAESALMR